LATSSPFGLRKFAGGFVPSKTTPAPNASRWWQEIQHHPLEGDVLHVISMK